MKKVLVALGVVTLLSVGSISYAMWGGGYGMMGGGPGYGGGYGYGGQNYGMMGGGMMGGGYGMMRGGGMMRGYGPGNARFENTEEAKKFFEETADTRRELNTKRFELSEAYRSGDETAFKAIEKDVNELRKKLYEKSGSTNRARTGFSPETCGGPYNGG